MCCATSTKLGWRVHAHCVLSLEFSFQKSQKFLKSKKKREKSMRLGGFGLPLVVILIHAGSAKGTFGSKCYDIFINSLIIRGLVC